MTSPAVLRARGFLRKTGLNRVLAKAISHEGYEARYARALTASVEPGACIWDIGANTGLYTVELARLSGPGGPVHAFEPSPPNLLALRDTVAEWQNVTVHPLAISDAPGEVTFVQGADAIGATSHIAADHGDALPKSGQKSDGTVYSIRAETGDSIIASAIAPVPDLMKIDVEGHELSVLSGMGGLLGNRRLRHVFAEIHFDIMRQNGIADGPRRIEALLAAAGFSVRWTDPSHIHASR